MRSREHTRILNTPAMHLWACALLSLTATAANAAESDDGGMPDARTILARADVAEGFDSMYAEAQQVITTTTGDERTLGMRNWAIDNGDRQLSEYLSPSDIKGQRILMTDDGDNIWMFNPETRRTRRLGRHMKRRKVMGSDFTYEDQASGNLSAKYSPAFVRVEEYGGVRCYVLDLTPTPRGPSYGRIRAWFGSDDYLMRRADYFRKSRDGQVEQTPYKRLTSSDVQQIRIVKSGKDADETPKTRPMATRITMVNLEDSTSTVMTITRALLGVDIPARIFEPRNLGR